MSVPRKCAPLLSRLHDAIFCSRGRVRYQAACGQRIVPRTDGISVAIAHYNRGRLAHRPVCNLLNHDFVREVVFFDDGSRADELAHLKSFVKSLAAGDRLRVETRSQNLGAQATKLDAVEACLSEWVLVLDSDNTAFPGYLDALSLLRNKHPETIYCSPYAFPYFSFRPLAGRTLDFDACADLTRSGVLRRVLIINDGNYLVHRETYLQQISALRTLQSDVADVMLANYLWLSSGGVLKVLKNGVYHHRIDPSSFYLQTEEESRKRIMDLFSRFSCGQRWDSECASYFLGT